MGGGYSFFGVFLPFNCLGDFVLTPYISLDIGADSSITAFSSYLSAVVFEQFFSTQRRRGLEGSQSFAGLCVLCDFAFKFWLPASADTQTGGCAALSIP
jgi:hypothetical protein